ncbi:aldehyde ferredoxin oxidoreductase family protein [Thermodesulfobacteriota bacterium]
MLYGYMGRMLFVDLTTGKIEEKVPDDEFYRRFLGGYGIGARVLFNRQGACVDPLGEENILGFITGPMTGTAALFGARFTIVAKSPLTSTWGDANCGGVFGPYLKFAGYDAVFFRGIAGKPVYLLLDEGKAEIRDADHLWGKETWETEDILNQEFGRNTSAALIGPSGEKLSLISAVITDRGRAAARSGLGAVMGSKRLKAVVVRGQQQVPIADKGRLEKERRRRLRELRQKLENPVGPGLSASMLRQVGTSGLTSWMAHSGGAAVKNWGGVGKIDFPNPEAIGSSALIKGQQRRYGCWRCPIACGGVMKAGRGRYRYRAGVHKPEYETIAAFGLDCLNDNLESIVKLNDICNRYGLDTISTGSTIAFAIECYENGLINSRDTQNIELTWGNDHAIVQMTEKLARREGFGDILADGVQRAAERIGKGAADYAIHVHGQELPSGDPRRFPFFSTTYALDATPSRHTQGSEGWAPPDLELPTFDRKSYSGRGEAHKMGSNIMHAINCAGVCQFGYMFCVSIHALPEFLSAATGMEYTMSDLLNVGERVANLRQAFNVREGLDRADVSVPGRILGKPPLQEGPTAGRKVDLEALATDYLAAMEWDVVTGKPSRKKLLELGLNDVAESLWSAS